MMWAGDAMGLSKIPEGCMTDLGAIPQQVRDG
jgi:hypothetical protein